MGVVGLVLLIASVNLANLLAREGKREKELPLFALRSAPPFAFGPPLLTEALCSLFSAAWQGSYRILGPQTVVVVPSAVSRRRFHRSFL
jgi:hypothetical protein